MQFLTYMLDAVIGLSFVEAHMVAFAQEDYPHRLVCRPAPEA